MSVSRSFNVGWSENVLSLHFLYIKYYSYTLDFTKVKRNVNYDELFQLYNYDEIVIQLNLLTFLVSLSLQFDTNCQLTVVLHGLFGYHDHCCTVPW